MVLGASGSALGNQFDDFLLASVRDERNGPLSVLSALARLDVDPWRTAATLAELPRASAVQRLASLFSGLPDQLADRDAIAARLVALLPSPAGSHVVTLVASTLTRDEAKARNASFVVIYIVSMLAVLCAQGLAASHQTLPAPGSQAPAVGKALTPTLPTSANH
jgi:hypothetical protein